MKKILVFEQSGLFLLPAMVNLLAIELEVKRSTALEKLRRQVTNQILNLKQMLEHCQNTILKINFQEIDQQVLEKTRN